MVLLKKKLLRKSQKQRPRKRLLQLRRRLTKSHKKKLRPRTRLLQRRVHRLKRKQRQHLRQM